ncbi:MAG: DUF3326 domain-containing protein [Candidatus Gastranaerophilales bacterium]|nr:DUF3326 domain-containing protein [Candidatus Gastranaerophilales bacterium]
MPYKKYKNKLSLFIVPTGIGASIGGYAGDASPYAQKIAKTFPLIVNPNVVNAACFSGIRENMFYVEGWSIGQFMKGNLSLKPSTNNSIGIIFDKAISNGILNIHLNTIGAVKTVYSCNIMGYEITEEECGIEYFMTPAGVSSGRVQNNETMLKAAKKLIERGAQTIAVVCKFEEPPEDNYKFGNSPDIVGGIEAIISHYLTKELMIPVVHAPAFEEIDITTDLVDARASAEYITPTFLPCLLLGLQNAPLIFNGYNDSLLNCNDIRSIIVPHTAIGSSVVLDAIAKNIPILAVKENSTVLDINDCALDLQNAIIGVDRYKDCYNFLREVIPT